MGEYTIGSIVSAAPVLTGILKETLWCSVCHKAEKPAESPVFWVIWHSILAAVEQDAGRAEARLAAIDRLDLIGWLDQAQREARNWRQRYFGLLRDVEKWRDHLAEKAASAGGEDDASTEGKRRTALRRLWGLSEEILAAPDPLAAIIERNQPGQDTEESHPW